MSVSPLPPGILDRDDLLRALAEHDFEAAFTLLKKYAGLSQNRLAAACRLTPGKVSKIVNGQHRVTSYAVICRIADGLHIPGRMLGLAPRAWEQRGPESEEDDATAAPEEAPTADGPWRGADAVALAAQVTRGDLVMDRRAAARAIAAGVTTGHGLLAPLDGWLDPVAADDARARSGRWGTDEVAELESAARVLRSWDHRYGGGLRRKAVVGQLSEVSAALHERQNPEIEKRLFCVMAQLAGTAATMAWDSDMQRKAQEYYRLALRSAHAGGDRAFGANILAGMARQMLSAGHPQDALELVRLAQNGAGRTVNPRVRAMLHTREAWAMSAMGRAAAFRRATRQAEEALSEAGSGEDPYWIRYFDEAELAGVTGGRVLELARSNPKEHAEEAAERIRSALDQREGEARRSRALDRIGLAECAFLTGDTSCAVAETHRAADAAEATRSSRVRAQLRQLYPYTIGASASREVRDARGRLRALLAA